MEDNPQTKETCSLDEPVTTPLSTKESFVIARDLELKSIIGCPYSGVNLYIDEGAIFAIRGHNGSGKTALLLTLAGRMAATGGTCRVGGFNLPKQRNKVQRFVGLGLFSGLNDLQESLTVRYALGAEFELYGRPPKKEAVSDYLTEWHLADIADVRVKDLTADCRVRVGVALACVGNPRMIVVDDIEDQLTKTQSLRIMEHLVFIAHSKSVTIVVGCIERDLASLADGVYFLEKDGE